MRIGKHKFVILNTQIIVFERWLCVLPQCKALVLAVHSQETRNDSNETRRVLRETRRVSRETRRVSREARCVSREGGDLHLSGTVQLGNWQTLLHWQDKSSSTALGAGSLLIQSMVSLPSLRHHPEPIGKGIWAELWRLLHHIADWYMCSLLSCNAFLRCPGMAEAGLTLTLLSWCKRDGNATH